MRHPGLFICFFLLFSHNLHANTDSTGIKYIKGKLYVLHAVEKGQGLYGIAKRYGSTVQKIQEANPNLKTTISVGQVLMVPYGKTATVKETTAEKPAPKPKPTPKKQPASKEAEDNETDDATDEGDKEPIMHVVTKKETLHLIAVNHHLTEAQLKAWNKNLEKNGLKVGEKIIVGYRAKTEAKESPKPAPKAKPTPQPKVEKTVKVKPKPQPKEEKTKQTEKQAPKTGTGIKKEVTENGMGSWVDDGSIKSEISLAMHKTAPEGTIIKITNPMNGKYKYVKVVGNLPDNPDEKDILIKIGKNTADELDIRDKVFRIKMTYSIEEKK